MKKKITTHVKEKPCAVTKLDQLNRTHQEPNGLLKTVNQFHSTSQFWGCHLLVKANDVLVIVNEVITRYRATTKE